MTQFHVTTKNVLESPSAGYAFFVVEGFKDKDIKDLAGEMGADILALMKARKFTGAPSSTLAFPVVDDGGVHHIFFVGLGKKEKQITVERYRRALGCLMRAAQGLNVDSLAFALPEPKLFGITFQRLASETVSVSLMANYYFGDFITDEARHLKAVKNVYLSVATADKKAAQEGVKEGLLIGEAVNTARHWVDLPSNVFTPTVAADLTKKMAKEHGLTCKVFGQKEIDAMGMGGVTAVSQGSAQDAQFIVLEYTCKKKSAPRLAFIGKGITFDSGGISIKPALNMENMKDDMSGGAAVINAMRVLAQLKPDVNIVACVPFTENMPSGTATKPGDIVTFYNGKTAEIKNTDAEGRLVLADALSYAVKHYKPDAMVDVATLTGLCAYFFGPFYSAAMGQHPALMAKVEEASQTSGDRIWEVPMDNDYKKAVQAKVADLDNCGSPVYKAGSITAAFFLQAFVGETPWVHLDIAGTALDVPDISYFTCGATGVGVRLLVDLAMQWK